MAIPTNLAAKFEIHEWRNGIAILEHVFPQEWADILAVLGDFRLSLSYLVKDAAKRNSGDEDEADESGLAAAAGGGNKSKVAKWLDEKFTERGWVETSFSTAVTVSAQRRLKGHRRKGDPKTEAFAEFAYDAPTHNVDCYKNRVALEVEWNNKNPFFDRDLNNFRLLFELRAVDVGIIITRTDELDKEVFEPILGKRDAKQRYGATTTHMGKLLPLLRGGGGGGCPVIVFGITPALFDPNS